MKNNSNSSRIRLDRLAYINRTVERERDKEEEREGKNKLGMGVESFAVRVSPERAQPGSKKHKTVSLPEELIREEILPRLPITSLVRFKIVCKSWRCLFSDPRFVKQHNNYQNPDDNDCLVVHKSNHIAILSRYDEKFVLRSYGYRLIGSANGLVCIRSGEVLSIWNPATRQSMEFHLPPLGYGCLKRVGFGFDHVSNDYKVAICYNSLEFLRVFYAVYSCRSGTWTYHEFDHHDYEIIISKFEDSFTPTTMVKDSPYWTCSTIVSSRKDKINLSLVALKFDATSNEFKLLPDFSSDFSCEKTFKVLNMKGLLSFMAYELCPVRKLEVYSLDEENGCGGGVWSKMYCFGPFEEFRRFRLLQQGFKNGDEIVIYDNAQIYRYNHKMGTFECIPSTAPRFILDCFTHTPSLVSLQGMTSIYSKNQTPPVGQHSTTPLRLIDSLRDHLPF